MNPLIHLRRATSLFLVVLGFVWLSLLPTALAVSPAPDGGYPGDNTAEGQAALLSLTTGGYNTAVGFSSLRFNTTNGFNTAIGAAALFVNTADSNTATGAGALFRTTIGNQNTANGAFVLFSNTTGNGNVVNGYQTLFNNTTGGYNTANGWGAMFTNNTGSQNTANGEDALVGNTTGSTNTADGALALENNTTGNTNIALGFGAGINVTTANNVICIGADGSNTSNTCFIGNIFGVTTSGGAAVLINSNGKLGTVPSSRRFKDGINPMGQVSEALFALKPVAFRYKEEIDPGGIQQLGLVAEDVEKIDPNLVVRDKEGKPFSVRYDQVNAMLLNEFLKEHRKVQELETNDAEQQKAIKALTAMVKEQATQIQKVSAQLEVSKPAPQTVLNDQ